MEVSEEIKEMLSLPDMSQIGLVVRDLDKAIVYYEKALRLGPFVRPEISYTDKFYYEKPVDSEWLMGFCSLGPLEMELVQPLTGPTIYHDFLETRGEGLHHLGFDVKDMNRRVECYKKMGLRVLQNGRTPHGGFAYLDTAKIGGVIFELIQRPARRV